MKDDSNNKLDAIASKGEGYTVPDKYFEDFATKMSSRLPFREELDVPDENKKERKSSTWLRVRPYVYMAAMFAGAWCMIKMFSLMTATPDEVDIHNYPALSHALQDEQFVDDYLVDDISPYEIVDEYYDEGLVSIPISADELDQLLDSTTLDDLAEHPGYTLPIDNISQR